MIARIIILILLSLQLSAVTQEGLVYKNRDTVIQLLKNQEINFNDIDEIYKNDRQIALLALEVDVYSFEYFNSNLKKDREIVKKAVSQAGFLLEYADSSLRKDKELLNLALETSGYGLEFFDKKHRDDRAFVLKVISQNPYALEYASQRLKKDEELVLTALGLIMADGECDEEPELDDVSKYIDKELLNSKTFLLKLLNITPNVESIIPKKLQKDKEIVALLATFEEQENIEDENLSLLGRAEVLTLFKETPWIFQELNASLKKDKEFATMAIKYATSFLKDVDVSLQKDRTFVLPLFYDDLTLLEYMDEIFKNDKELLAPLVYKNPTILEYISEELKKDNAFMLDIFQKTKEGFAYLNSKQKKEKSLVREALENSECNFQYIDEKLKDDKPFILELLADFDIYDNISKRLQKDREVILASLKHGTYDRIDSVDVKLLKDKEFIEEAIHRNGYGFKYATKEQQSSKPLVREALKLNPEAFKYVDKSFRKDRKFILKLLKEEYNVFAYIDEGLKRDRAFVESAISYDGTILSDLDENLSKDKELVELALSETACALCSVDSTLQEDNDYMLHLVKTIGVGFEYLTKEQKADRGLILKMLNIRGGAYVDLNETQKRDKEYINVALKNDGWTLTDLPKDLKKDKKLIKQALCQNGWVLKSVPTPLNLDKEIVLTALRENGMVLEYVEKDLRKDKEIVLTALREDSEALTFVDNELRTDKGFLLEVINSPKLFKYMDKSLLEDKAFLKKIKEVTGITPDERKQKKINIVHSSSLIDVNGSMAREIEYTSYEDYQIHSSTWNASVDITKDKKYIISSTESKVNVWDVNSSLLFKQIDIGESIQDLALIDNEKSLLTLAYRELKIWDLEKGVLKKVLYKSDAYIWSMTLSPNKKWLAFFDENQSVHIYNLESNTIVQSFNVGVDSNLIFTIDNSGKYLAWGTYFTSDITLWDIEKAKKVTIFKRHRNDISSLYLASDNKHLVSSDNDGVIKIWDLESKKLMRTLFGSQREIISFDMSSDGKYLLSSSNHIELWDFEKGESLKIFPISDESSGSAKFINKNREILSYGYDNSIVIKDIASTKVIKKISSLKETSYVVNYSPDKRYLLIGFRGEESYTKVVIWDIEKNIPFKVLESNTLQIISAISMSKDSKYLFIARGWRAGGGENIFIEMWDMKRNKLFKTFKNNDENAMERENIFDIVLSPDGKYLASYITSGTGKHQGVELWSIEHAKLINFVPDFTGLSSSFVISQDSKQLIIGNKQGKLDFWDIMEQKFVKSEKISEKAIDDVALLGKDKLLITSGKKIYLRDLKEGKNIRTFDNQNSSIDQIIAMKSGKMFITESSSSLLNMWSIYSDEPINRLKMNNIYYDGRYIIGLNDDKKEIALAYEDGTVKLYALDNLKKAKKIFVFGNRKNWVVFDEVKKKMLLVDEKNFLLKKKQVYKDKNVTIFTYKHIDL